MCVRVYVAAALAHYASILCSVRVLPSKHSQDAGKEEFPFQHPVQMLQHAQRWICLRNFLLPETFILRFMATCTYNYKCTYAHSSYTFCFVFTRCTQIRP